MKKTVFFCAFLLLAAVSNRTLGAPENLLRMGYLWSPGLEPAVAGLEEALAELGHPSALVKPTMLKALGREMCNPDLRGLDLKRPMAAVLFIAEEEEPLPTYLVHLSDAKAFNQSISRYFSGQVKNGPEGIRVFSREIEALDEEAFKRASPDERKNLSQFYLTGTETLAVADGEGWAWLSRRPDALQTLLKTTPSDLIPPVRSNLVAVLDINHLGDKLTERIRAGMRDKSGTINLPPEISKVRDRMMDFVELWLRQVKTLAYGLTVNQKGLALDFVVDAEAGSPLGEFLQLQQPQMLSLARYLDPASAVVADYHLSLTTDWNRRITGFTRKMLFGIEAESEKHSVVTDEAIGLFAYPEEISEIEVAVSMRAGGKNLFSLLSVIKLSPTAIPPAFESRLFPVESVYRNVKIRRLLSTTEQNTFGEEPRPDQTPAIRAAKEFSWRLALVKGLIVSEFIMGETEGDIRPAIDRILDEKNLFDLGLLPPCRGSANYAFFVQLARITAALIDDRTPDQTREILQELDKAEVSLNGCALIKDGLIKYSSFIPIEKIKTLIELLSHL